MGLLNYLWPAFTLLFALPLLGYSGRWTLWPGMVVAIAGTIVATAPTGGLSWSGWVSRVGSNPLPYGLAFVAAIAWGLFSNSGRKWGPEKGIGALPLFVLVTGLLLTVLRLTAHEQPHWSLEAVGLVLWVSIFPISLAYAFWDIGVRTGSMVVLASLSYLIPALSTLISTLFLGVRPTAADLDRLRPRHRRRGDLRPVHQERPEATNTRRNADTTDNESGSVSGM